MTATKRKPRTHCSRGHEFAVVGRYGNGHCRACQRANALVRKAKLRRQKLEARERAAERRRQGLPVERPKMTIEEQPRTNLLLTLYERKESAATWWERDDIQRQIDEVKRA